MNLGLLFKVRSAMVFFWLFVILESIFWGCYAVMNVGLLFEVRSAMVFCFVRFDMHINMLFEVRTAKVVCSGCL